LFYEVISRRISRKHTHSLIWRYRQEGWVFTARRTLPPDLLALHAWLGRWNRNHCARTWPCVRVQAIHAIIIRSAAAHNSIYLPARGSYSITHYTFLLFSQCMYTARTASQKYIMCCVHTRKHVYICSNSNMCVHRT
jgi:hypothetical protein